MSQYGGNLDYIDRMNNSFDQGARAQQSDFLAQRNRTQGMDAAAIAENARRFNLLNSTGASQFDQRMNVLRDMFSRQGQGYAPMPNGPAQQPAQSYAMGMGGNGASPFSGQGQMTDYERARMDQASTVTPQVTNYLSQLLGRR